MAIKICPECSIYFPARDDLCIRCGTKLVTITNVEPRSGTIIEGRYEIVEKLGAGGMGTVFKATQVAMDRVVAIKVLKGTFASNLDVIKRFFREARSVSTLSHPNIITVHDFGQTKDGLLYLVMEYASGTSLGEVLEQGKPLGALLATRIAVQVCDALTEAHSKGIIHRDLKPDNIILGHRAGKPDFIKVLDFGIAKIQGGTDTPADISLTKTGQIMGTPPYIAPELISGHSATPATDLYALGVMLYEMITGVLPFNGSTPMSILMQHLTDEPPSLADRGAVDLPPELNEFIQRALAKRPADRPASASEFKDELVTALGTINWTTDGNIKSVLAPGVRRRSSSNRRRRSSSLLDTIEARQPTPLSSITSRPARRLVLPLVAVIGVLAMVIGGLLAASLVEHTTRAEALGAAASTGHPLSERVATALLGLPDGSTPGLDDERANEAAVSPDVTSTQPAEPLLHVEDEATEPPPRQVTMTITSVPSGAYVDDEGLVVGTTPYVVTLPPSDDAHTYTVSLDGYVPAPLEVVATADVTHDVHLELQDTAPPPAEPVAVAKTDSKQHPKKHHTKQSQGKKKHSKQKHSKKKQILADTLDEGSPLIDLGQVSPLSF